MSRQKLSETLNKWPEIPIGSRIIFNIGLSLRHLMGQRFSLAFNLKLQKLVATWLFRTLIWWFTAWYVPKVGFEMIWFAAIPAGISLLIWPAKVRLKEVGLWRWLLMGLLATAVFGGQSMLMELHLTPFFLIAGSVLTAVLVCLKTTYFSY